MKVFSAAQINAWDEYTMLEEPIASIDLMERAAYRCVEWVGKFYPSVQYYAIFCGKGNNGGDGLAIARLLAEQGKEIQVHILEFGFPGTADFQQNLARLHQYPKVQIQYIQSTVQIYPVKPDAIIIDALVGAGLNRKLDGLAAELVQHINSSQNIILSIDIPSGLYCDQTSKNNLSIRATHTLSFTPKLAFYVAENATSLGTLHYLDIQLHPTFHQHTHSLFEILDKKEITSLIKKRNSYSHKGNFGHGLLIAGSKGKMGAAILAVQGAIRAGIGLITCHIPGCGYSAMQSSVPEAMVSIDTNETEISSLPTGLNDYSAIGIGPGVGKSAVTLNVLNKIFSSYTKPIALDADALNLMAMKPSLLAQIPRHSILTPHPGEFKRLFGETSDNFELIDHAIYQAKELDVYILLKGFHSFIACPTGIHFFNPTGNAGMARGGAGDTLTGILTALLAQGYSSENALKIGVFLHGLAGDIAAAELTMEGMTIADLIGSIGKAWKQLIPTTQ